MPAWSFRTGTNSCADRDGNYALHTSPGRLVFVVLPKGYRSTVSIRTPRTGKQLNFPLIAWPESNHDVVRFAQITDIHISGRNAAGPFASDLEEINRYSPKVAFVLATGDLANSGKDTEFEDYCRAVAHRTRPYSMWSEIMTFIGGDANYLEIFLSGRFTTLSTWATVILLS